MVVMVVVMMVMVCRGECRLANTINNRAAARIFFMGRM